MSFNADFHVTIGGSPGNYTVEARGARQIQVSPVPFVYNNQPGALCQELERIKSGYAPSRWAMKAIGQLLYNALFPRSVYEAWARSQAQLPEGGNLRLKLNVRPPELSHLPWELLYDSCQGYFWAARLSYPIVRTIESRIPVASTLARHPLRVLYLQANPFDTAPLDLAASEKALRQALGGDCEIKVVRQTTPDALMRVLRERPGFHILHYDGHAIFDKHSGEGHLALHSAKNLTHWLSGETLATILDGTSVRLVVLAACKTGMDSTDKRFAGIAQHLMHTSNLPAAVAMQFAIPDHSAICFTRHFYQALAADYPIEDAVVEGRKGILTSPRAARHSGWAAPVLFMRAKDGHILRPMIEPERAQRDSMGRRRFEGAMPSTSKVEKVTEVRVMVSLPNSQGLRAYLPHYTKSNDLIRKEDLVHHPVSIDFPIDATTGEPKATIVFVKVTAPEFNLAEASQNLRIPPNSDSGIVTFFLTPEAGGQDKRVKVELFKNEQQKVLIGSLTLMTDVKGRWYPLIGIVWQLATLPFASRQKPQPNGHITDEFSSCNVTILGGTFTKSKVDYHVEVERIVQTIGSLPAAEPMIAQLKALVAQLHDALKKVPPEQRDAAKMIVELTEQLVAEAGKEKQNSKITADGLKEAAQNMADVTEIVARMLKVMQIIHKKPT